MHFRKRPVEIEAFIWTGDHGQTEDPAWIVEAMDRGDVWLEAPGLRIRTLEGVMTANRGDYVIRGVKGEVYPCKPDIFAATYDPIPDSVPLANLLDRATPGTTRRRTLIVLAERAGIRDVAELARKTRGDLLRTPHVGRVTLADAEQLLAEHGRRLAGS